MKKALAVVLLCAVAFACKKEPGYFAPPPPKPPGTDGYIANVKAYLKSNLSSKDFDAVDFNNLVVSTQTGGWYLRAGVLNKALSSEFILLQTDSNGYCTAGKYVLIDRDSSDLKTFNGNIVLQSLQRETVTRQVIQNNAVQLECAGEVDIESLGGAANGCTVVPSCSDCLPEVVVVGYISSAGGGVAGISYSDYLNLASLANGAGYSSAPGSSGSPAGVYSPVVVGGGPATGTGPVKKSPDISVSYEQSVSKPAIDVNAFMKCFAAVPDAGAQCSVTIFDDLPVNDNPAYIFNILSGATGHCFLQLTKTNGAQSVEQVIGFTTSKPLAVLGVPVPGKIIDNAGHKYNATLTMNISPAQLATEINAITALGNNMKYDIWENNCVNYAVNILNKVRPSNPLEVIQLNDVTSGDSYSTPQGLYLMLEEMKQENNAEAANITIDVVKNAGASHGACTP